MADNSVARPYAKAVFQYALEQGQLKEWSYRLAQLSAIVSDKEVIGFIDNPNSRTSEQIELIMSLLPKLEQSASGLKDEALTNLVTTLANNERLFVLPGITQLFDTLRAEQEKTIHVDVRSYTPLSDEQKVQLVAALSKRLERQVDINIIVDKSLLGGAIITAGNMVLDGSVIGKLNSLKAELAA